MNAGRWLFGEDCRFRLDGFFIIARGPNGAWALLISGISTPYL